MRMNLNVNIKRVADVTVTGHSMLTTPTPPLPTTLLDKGRNTTLLDEGRNTTLLDEGRNTTLLDEGRNTTLLDEGRTSNLSNKISRLNFFLETKHFKN
ncbi:hypothetical protein Bpfe_010595 [Biomphalaria pfeifferi]|uniref:Uncharacterized protein n=1 Tax=Biomphalaria pfeifferi TaxID=112525 RepID=A0AAD8BU14_BIOPF|nr:hypothetical protein Bpfe_010595 [Biomphalaria pfeifferi]